MYVYLSCEVWIGDKVFRRVHDLKIESSAKVLEDTATIKLPTTARLVRGGEYLSEIEVAKYFLTGEEVRILIGYNGDLREEFRGFIRKIKPNTPVEIECEDATYLLRRKTLKKAFRATTLKVLLDYIIEGTGIELVGEVPKISFSHFYFKSCTGAFALQKLKEEYGLTIYFKAFKKLYVSLAYHNDDVEVKYSLRNNTIAPDSLEWVSEDDTRLKIKAVHIRKDNTKIEKEVGDADGEVRTLFFYDLDKGESLEKRAKEEILKYKYNGYKGSITTFLRPDVEVGNVAVIQDKEYSDRDGKYIVDKVVTTFGTTGARRVVGLGLKVSVQGDDVGVGKLSRVSKKWR